MVLVDNAGGALLADHSSCLVDATLRDVVVELQGSYVVGDGRPRIGLEWIVAVDVFSVACDP